MKNIDIMKNFININEDMNVVKDDLNNYSLKTDTDGIKGDIEFLDLVTSNVFNNNDVGYLYEPVEITLDTAWQSFYTNGAIPKVAMTNDGQLKFTGNAKIKTQGTYNYYTDGTIKLGVISNIPLADKEGVPIRGHMTCCKANGGMKVIPVVIQGDATLCIPNTGGTDDEYYARVDLSSLTINLMNFGDNVVKTQMNSVVQTVINRGNDFHALFFTDLHYDLSKVQLHKRNMEAINYIDDLLELDCIISGGDNIIEPFNNFTNPKLKQAIQSHKAIYSKFKKNKFIYCNGNHDNNSTQNYPNNTDTTVLPKHLKPLFNNKEMIWAGEDKYYGYMDIESSKTRVVVWDVVENNVIPNHTAAPKVSAEQINWICKNALNMLGKIGWKVLFVGHIPPLDDETITSHLIPTRQAIRNVIGAFRNGIDTEVITGDLIRFSLQGQQTVVGWLGGHNHKDTITVVDGVSYVTSLLAWCTSVTGNPRAYGHSWEFCFDIVSINESTRTVYLDRVGRGSSRSFNY